MELYKQIYLDGNKVYWDRLAVEIEEYCEEYSISHTNYFYHEKLVEQKKQYNNQRIYY